MFDPQLKMEACNVTLQTTVIFSIFLHFGVTIANRQRKITRYCVLQKCFTSVARSVPDPIPIHYNLQLNIELVILLLLLLLLLLLMRFI